MSGLAYWRLDEIVLSFVPTGDGFYILLQPLGKLWSALSFVGGQGVKRTLDTRIFSAPFF